MSNEHDDDKRPKRPFSERINDDSHKLPPEAAKLAGHFKEEDERIRRLVDIPLPPAKELILSHQQIEAIAEAVANRVVAKLKAEPK